MVDVLGTNNRRCYSLDSGCYVNEIEKGVLDFDFESFIKKLIRHKKTF